MYLREMGSVSLLTREGEVEIAKRIEEGEKEVINAVLDSPLTIKEIIQLGERLRSKKVRPKELAPDLEDEDESFWEEEFNVQRILSLIDQIDSTKKPAAPRQASQDRPRPAAPG
jgi:RNA polymerase primary sigma factor